MDGALGDFICERNEDVVFKTKLTRELPIAILRRIMPDGLSRNKIQ
jgi:hypothetical protein